MTASPEWAPTHRVPDAGLAAWEQPDPARPSDRQLRPGTVVGLAEEQGGWARVVLQHGRTWWVDSRLLVPIAISAGKRNAVLDLLAGPQSGMLALVAVIALTLAISLVLAPVLALPGNILKDLIPVGRCVDETPGSGAMFVCSVKVGFLTALGPLMVLVTGLVFRRPLMSQMRKVTSKLPRNANMLITPALATTLFTMVYASVHSKTMSENGIVPQRLFPVVLGVLVFLATRLRGSVAKRFGALIVSRDRIPLPLRGAIVLVLPLAVAYFIMKQDEVTETATKEQFVALLTMFTSYAALVPRDGDFVGAAQRLLMSKGLGRLKRSVPGASVIPPGGFVPR